jgi:serine acetyltransferase
MSAIFDQPKLDLLRADIARRARKSGLEGIAASFYFRQQTQHRTLLWYRLREAARSSFVRAVCDRLYLRSSRQSGLEILTSSLGGGVIMPHWGRIVLNAESIGSDLYVFHNVTIGDDYVSGKPTIGSDVFLGTGSTVIGKITVGDHVMVAAGSVVVDDVPTCSVVAGNPAKVVREIAPGRISEIIGY